MPHLLPNSVFFYHPVWMGPGGRLIWGVLFATFGLLWTMMMMKHRAVKTVKAGPGIFVVGIGVGVVLVWLGHVFLKTPLVENTLVPNGYLILWVAGIAGIWTTIMSIRFNPLKLPVNKIQHVLLTLVLIVALYVIGGFVYSVSILMSWFIMFTILISISLFVWSLPRFTEEGTWAQAIAGALASFVMMTFIYAIIPHEWITFATSYLSFTKDAKVSTGGQFVLNTWFSGHFWTKKTRILPFEVNYETLQDQATMAIYIIGATMNIKIFAAWQKRNDPLPVVAESEVSETPSKLSRFGRPLRALKTSKA